MEKRGNERLIDTPQRFAMWQTLKGETTGSGKLVLLCTVLSPMRSPTAVLAAILRESIFVYGQQRIFQDFIELSYRHLTQDPLSVKVMGSIG
jgi:hypothetical protein